MGCSHQCRVCGGEDGRGLRWVCPVSYIALGVRFIPIKMIRHLPISLKTAGRKNTGTKKNLPSLEQGRLHPFDRNESKYCFLMPPELNVSAPQSPNRCLSIKKKKKNYFCSVRQSFTVATMPRYYPAHPQQTTPILTSYLPTFTLLPLLLHHHLHEKNPPRFRTSFLRNRTYIHNTYRLRTIQWVAAPSIGFLIYMWFWLAWVAADEKIR